MTPTRRDFLILLQRAQAKSGSKRGPAPVPAAPPKRRRPIQIVAKKSV
jgi:hypothetical protein